MDEKARLKQVFRKLVQIFHPDRHEQDPEKRKTYERLAGLQDEAERVAEEARELAGEVPF